MTEQRPSSMHTWLLLGILALLCLLLWQARQEHLEAAALRLEYRRLFDAYAQLQRAPAHELDRLERGEEGEEGHP